MFAIYLHSDRLRFEYQKLTERLHLRLEIASNVFSKIAADCSFVLLFAVFLREQFIRQ